MKSSTRPRRHPDHIAAPVSRAVDAEVLATTTTVSPSPATDQRPTVADERSIS